jgi:hypothetical protein
LIRFQRVLGPMHEVCNKLTHLSLRAFDPDVRPYFQDVLDHVRRVETRVGGLREVLTSVFEASNLLEQPPGDHHAAVRRLGGDRAEDGLRLLRRSRRYSALVRRTLYPVQESEVVVRRTRSSNVAGLHLRQRSIQRGSHYCKFWGLAGQVVAID